MAKPVKVLLAGALVLLVALAGIYVVVRGYPAEVAHRAAEARTAGRAVPINDLDSVSQLQSAFNDGQGTPRLVLLLSPT